jgi:hypothetical protein
MGVEPSCVSFGCPALDPVPSGIVGMDGWAIGCVVPDVELPGVTAGAELVWANATAALARSTAVDSNNAFGFMITLHAKPWIERALSERAPALHLEINYVDRVATA